MTATSNASRRFLTGSLIAGGVAVGGAVFLGLTAVAEGYWARQRLLASRIPDAIARTGLFGAEHTGEPLELALLGDSLAVGMGAENGDQTIGVLLANGVASASGHPVQLRNVAAIGSESKDLPGQIAELGRPEASPAVALIVVGGNEIMHLQNIDSAVRHLSQAVRDLRREGYRVVVATCPDMGTVRTFVPPLRFIAHWLSRILATAQTIVVLRSGGRTVSLGDTLGPIFWSDPTLMFSADHLHPSSSGYARAADVLLPSVCAAAGYRTGTDAIVPHRVYRKDLRSPLMVGLAFRASRRAGMETNSRAAREGRLIEIGRRTMLRIHGRIQPLVRTPGRQS